MEELNILPTTLYKYDIPDDIHTSILKELPYAGFETREQRDGKPHYGKSAYGGTSLHRQENWKFLCDFINPKVKEVATKVGYTWFEDIKVSLMWANVSNEGQWHHAHRHPWSILSGIIYIQGESGDTWFSSLNPYAMENRMFNGHHEGDGNQIIHKHKPVNQTMLIFPSMLLHSVSENESPIPRITISFNSYFDGTVGDEYHLSGLTLKLQ